MNAAVDGLREHRPSGRGRVGPALLAAAGALAVGAPAAAQVGPSAAEAPAAMARGGAGEREQRLAGLLATLSDAAAPRADRLAAADALIDDSRDRRVLDAVGQIIERSRDASGAQEVLVAALARRSVAPAHLLTPLSRQVESAPAERLPGLLLAVGSFRTREAAQILLAHAGPGRPAAVRSAAFASLVRLSGREDLGQDVERWREWLRSAERLSEPEWQASLVAGLAARTDRLATDEAAARTRLVEAYRRIYLVAPAEDRPGLLVGMLTDAVDDLRALGLDFVAREMAAGTRTIDAGVLNAVVGLLRHPRADVRARAASMVNQLAPPDAGPAVAAALHNETDPEAAAALLSAADRWPSEAIRAPAIRWLEAGGVAREPAVEALLALHRQGLLHDTADYERILAVLRTGRPGGLSAAGCRLLVALGGPAEREHVASLLDDEAHHTRRAAAEALVDRREYLDRLLEAAQHDPGLFDIAARAVQLHRPTAAGYRALAALSAATPEAHREGLIAAAGRLPPGELLAIARDMRPDSDLREAVLSRVARRTVLEDGLSPNERHAVYECLLLLAETRLALGRPDAALAALDTIPDDIPEPQRVDRLRLIALLWTNHLDRAAELDTPAAVWLDGLERCIGEPHATDVAAALSARFGSSLTPEEADRLQALLGRIEPPVVEGPPAPAAAPEEPPSGGG